jgi:hypothetical protein
MLKEYARVAGAIYVADFFGPKIANALIKPEVDGAGGGTQSMLNSAYVVGARLGAGLLGYYLLGKVGV